MTRRRTAVLAVAAWLIVVTGCAALAWTVISRVGEDVAGTQPVVQTGSTGNAGPNEQTPTDGPSPSASDSPSGSASPSSPSQSASPSATTSSDAPETVDPVRRTWQGAAGIVVVECRGNVVDLTGAQPASGWKVEVDDAGPERVRVEFETADEETRVRVEAVCADGAPAFSEDPRTKG